MRKLLWKIHIHYRNKSGQYKFPNSERAFLTLSSSHISLDWNWRQSPLSCTLTSKILQCSAVSLAHCILINTKPHLVSLWFPWRDPGWPTLNENQSLVTALSNLVQSGEFLSPWGQLRAQHKPETLFSTLSAESMGRFSSNLLKLLLYKVISVVEWLWVISDHNTEIVGSNPTEAWMFVCVLCAFFLFLHSLKWDSQPT
jgi:hypothetical protein